MIFDYFKVTGDRQPCSWIVQSSVDYATHEHESLNCRCFALSQVASSQLRHRRCCGLVVAFAYTWCPGRGAELKRPRRFLFVYLGAQLLQRFDFLILFFAAILVSALRLFRYVLVSRSQSLPGVCIVPGGASASLCCVLSAL